MFIMSTEARRPPCRFRLSCYPLPTQQPTPIANCKSFFTKLSTFMRARIRAIYRFLLLTAGSFSDQSIDSLKYL